MKLVFGMFAMVASATALVYYTGGYANFDPDQQGRDARAAVAPGMTWNQVITAIGEPKKYRLIEKKVRQVGSREIESYEVGPPARYNPNTFTGTTPNGFILEYRYSEQVAFGIEFNAGSQVVAINDLATMADLLQTRRR